MLIGFSGKPTSLATLLMIPALMYPLLVLTHLVSDIYTTNEISALTIYTYTCVKLINPWHTCAARVTVVGFVCLSVCLSVCWLSHTPPLERLFVLESMSHTQWATKVNNVWGFL